MLQAAFAELRNAFARIGRAVPFAQLRLVGLLGLILIAVPQMALGQHCGRIGYVVSTDSETLSWERADAGLGTVPAGELFRIRETGCDGPLCRSQSPVPFVPGSHANAAAAPLPWKCTALCSVARQPDPVARVDAATQRFFEIPFIEPLAEPPRSV